MNVHFHCVLPDGVFARVNGNVELVALRPPWEEEVFQAASAAIRREPARRIESGAGRVTARVWIRPCRNRPRRKARTVSAGLLAARGRAPACERSRRTRAPLRLRRPAAILAAAPDGIARRPARLPAQAPARRRPHCLPCCRSRPGFYGASPRWSLRRQRASSATTASSLLPRDGAAKSSRRRVQRSKTRLSSWLCSPHGSPNANVSADAGTYPAYRECDTRVRLLRSRYCRRVVLCSGVAAGA